MIISKLKIGDVFDRKNGNATVIEIEDARNVKVITNNGTKFWCALNNLTKGEVKDPLDKTFYGKGYIGFGRHNSKSKCYTRWKAMLARCYGVEAKSNLCEEWHSLQVFGEWFDNNYLIGYVLDKDLKVPGNKIYSPETCMFIPNHLNILFNNKPKEITIVKAIEKYPEYCDILNNYIKTQLK